MKKACLTLMMLVMTSLVFASNEKLPVESNNSEIVYTDLLEGCTSSLNSIGCCTVTTEVGHNSATVTNCSSSSTNRNCRRAGREARRELRGQSMSAE